MIHSLSGGILRDKQIKHLAKVEVCEGLDKGLILWYEVLDNTIKDSDLVLIPFGKTDKLITAKVLKIVKNVNEQASPVSFKRIKQIYAKV